MKRLAGAVCLLSCLLSAEMYAASTDHLIQAILHNDVGLLRAELQTGADANSRGERDTTLLMYAAAYGSVDAVQALLAAGANVNAVNAQKATSLIWAANDIDKVRLLLGKGADVNAASALGRQAIHIAAASDKGGEIVPLLMNSGADPKARDARNNTTLLLAALADNFPLVRMLIDEGVDVNAAGKNREWTPLMAAAGLNNLDAVQLLLAKGANPNAMTAEHMDGSVKNGVINLGHMTALMFAAPHGTPAMIKTLLAARANPKAQDVRGMTPLMLAVASERQNPAVVRMLLEAGADPSTKDSDGETAEDWAAKFHRASTMRLLGEHATGKTQTIHVAAGAANDARKAAERAIAELQSTSLTFFEKGGCMACHHSDMTAFAVGVANARGIHTDAGAAAALVGQEKRAWGARQDLLLQRIETGGEAEALAYAMLGFSAMNYPVDLMTAAMAADLAASQNRDGSWRRPTFARVPMQDSDITRTALTAHAIRAYTPPGRRAEFDERVRRSGEWLSAAVALDNEERAMRLLGLQWTGARQEVIRKAAKELMAAQQGDGGWRQNADLATDAYATGISLYALHEAYALMPSDAVYRRGVNFLLATQAGDGSWHVSSRAVKLQPYFQSGFPYDHDQWISATATAWASAALAQATDEQVLKARR